MSPIPNGSDAVIKDAPCLGALGKYYIGEDVVVHRVLVDSEIPPQLRRHPAGKAAPFYLASTRDGIRTVLCGHCLAPKPDNAHTWAGIEALTGWRPPAATPSITTSASTPAGGAA